MFHYILNFLCKHELIYKINLQAVLSMTHYAYMHRFLKRTDDGEGELVCTIFHPPNHIMNFRKTISIWSSILNSSS
jgi:hypothetical protein